MFEMIRQRPKRRQSLQSAAARLLQARDGAAAVEFGLVAAPFLALVFAIIETAIVFFAGQALETAVADSSGLILTGLSQAIGVDRKMRLTSRTLADLASQVISAHGDDRGHATASAGNADFTLHPGADDVIGDRDIGRSGQPVWMRSRQHELDFLAVEPTRILELRPVYV